MQPRWHVVIRRKQFHILELILFAPVYVHDSQFLAFSMSVAMCVFLLAELLRLLPLSGWKTWIHRYYAPFMDGKDEGVLVLSHIYLLLGCALPIWMEQWWDGSFLTKASGAVGILYLGIGDTAASMCGKTLGRTKWPHSSKTMEGTLANMATMTVTLRMCYSILWKKSFLLACYGALLESFTGQNDNLIVPMVMFAIHQCCI